MRTALRIINEAMAAHRKACLAFSGGSDSVLLMDLIFRHTEHRPVVVFADSQMEYPETEAFCRRYVGITAPSSMSPRQPIPRSSNGDDTDGR